MKVLFQDEPTNIDQEEITLQSEFANIDELIFAGETHGPSDR